MKRFLMIPALCALFVLAMMVGVSLAADIHVYGAQKRVDTVINWLKTKDASAFPHYQTEFKGQFNGKKDWPGVVVTTTPDVKESGIFIPVSDSAIKQGLCSDQMALLDQLIQAKSKQAKGKPWGSPPAPPEETKSKKDCPDCGERLLTPCKRLGEVPVDGVSQPVLFTACSPETGNHNPSDVAGKWTYMGYGKWALEVVRYVNYVPKDANDLVPEAKHPVWKHMREISSRTEFPKDAKVWDPCNYQVFRP